MTKKRLIKIIAFSLTLFLFICCCACTGSLNEESKPVVLSDSQQKFADAVYNGRSTWIEYKSVPCKILEICVFEGNYYLAASYYESEGKPFSLNGNLSDGNIGTVATVKYYSVGDNGVSGSFEESESTLHTWAKTIARIQLSGYETDDELRQSINLLASK